MRTSPPLSFDSFKQEKAYKLTHEHTRARKRGYSITRGGKRVIDSLPIQKKLFFFS